MDLKKHGFNEPEWILDETKHGELFWRRKSNDHRHTRVTFRHHVQVKEIEKRYEIANYPSIASQMIGISLSCVICVLVTAVLPWYLVLGS